MSLKKSKQDCKLKKCPCCGCVPTWNSFDGCIFWISCMCGLKTISFDLEQDAVDCWNTRFEDKTAQKN